MIPGTSPMGAEALPDVPAAADLVSGYEAGSWFGIGAPKATASGVIRQLKTRFYRGRVFLLGACHEHPRVMLKEARRLALSLALLGLPCPAPPQPDSCPVQTARRMRGRLAVGLP